VTPIDVFPDIIKQNYEIHEWKHACAILREDFPREFADVVRILSAFRLCKSEIIVPGGSKSPTCMRLEELFRTCGWKEQAFTQKHIVDGRERETKTHRLDCYKNRVAAEVEWNSKDSVFIRDLNNFRILFDLDIVSVGIIVTRCDELQQVFNELVDPKGDPIGRKYGDSTTHMGKLLPRLESGGGGGCPILAFGIRRSLYRPDL